MKKNNMVDLRITLAGLKLKIPIIAASGTFGYGDEYNKLSGFDASEFGAITLKGTTLKPRLGNPTPRLVETASGLINSIGLENVGVEKLVEEILPRLKNLDTIIIANIAGDTLEEYGEVAAALERSDAVSALEVNISCPNVKEGGKAFGKNPVVAGKVMELVKRASNKVIIAKLTPEVTDIAEIAEACIDGGAQVISLINTYPAIAIDISTGKAILGNNFGGLSGPAIKPIALSKVYQVYQRIREKELNIPIIGGGGIWNGNDAIEFMLAGADAVSIGTAIMANPFTHRDILVFMEKYLRDLSQKERNEGYLKISSIVGKLELN